MPLPFSRSLRSLDADHHRRSMLGFLAVTAVLGGWLAWLLLASVAVYEAADAARLEVDRAAHPVASHVAGRVVATHLAIGREVRVGEVLVELDTEGLRLELREERSRIAALSAELAALREREAATQQAHLATGQASPLALDEARARHAEVAAAAEAAAEEAARIARLHSDGLVAEMDLVRARAEARKQGAAAEALRVAVDRLDRDQHARLSTDRAQLEALRGERASVAGEIQTRQATMKRLEHAIDDRLIRARIGGRLGEVAELRVGSVVQAGEKVAAILPPGRLRAVAELPPSALGRVAAGQRARLRLDGFPWTEYGGVRATVAKVAAEPRDGRVRVELEVDRDSAPAIPLQHGLPGRIEIEVERVSPAELVLRAAGKRLSGLGRGAKAELDGIAY